MSTKVVRSNRLDKVEPSAVIYVKVCSKKEEIFSSTLHDESNESFLVQKTFDDSDTRSQDNWRNKGKKEKISCEVSPIKSMDKTLINKNTSQVFSPEKSFDSTLIVNNKAYRVRVRKIVPS